MNAHSDPYLHQPTPEPQQNTTINIQQEVPSGTEYIATLERAHTCLDVLDTNITGLIIKIEPIMRPANPEAVSAAPREERELSRVVDCTESLCNKINKMNDLVAILSERIQ